MKPIAHRASYLPWKTRSIRQKYCTLGNAIGISALDGARRLPFIGTLGIGAGET